MVSILIYNNFKIANNIQFSDSEEALKNFPLRAFRPPFIPKYIWSRILPIIVFWNAMCVVTHDCTIMVFLSEIITQVKLLLSNLRQLSVTRTNDGGGLTINRKLGKSVRHHQKIKDFLKIFEQTYSGILLGQFFTSMVMFGLVGFQATVTSGYSRAQFTINAYCVCIFLELYLVCSLAHEIIEEVKNKKKKRI